MAFSPVANAAPNKKFDFLIRFFDLNEAAFAYQRHCLGRSEEIDQTFLKAMEFVADELFSEGIKNSPNVKPEYIKAKILERRYNIQYQLDNANIKEGCMSANSQLAQSHYKEFSRFNTAQVKQFIDEQTQDQK